MYSFITGSQAHGTAKEESDIDLVILADVHTKVFLTKYSEHPVQIRFGKLNLIIVQTPEEWAAWKLGTLRVVKELKDDPRATREDIIAMYEICRRQFGFSYEEGSSG